MEKKETVDCVVPVELRVVSRVSGRTGRPYQAVVAVMPDSSEIMLTVDRYSVSSVLIYASKNGLL